MASASGAKPSETADKSEKKSDSISKQIRSVLKNAVIGLVVIVLLVFILGEAYAFYAMRFSNSLLLWLPVFALVAVLVYKVFD